MNTIIGKEENALFEKGAIYDCVIKGEINEQLYCRVMPVKAVQSWNALPSMY